MAIAKAQWARRLKAGLEIQGIHLADLPDIEGFPKRAAARAAHPSDSYMASDPLARSVADQLDLPAEWFTAPDFSAWLSSLRQPAEPAALERIEAGLDHALDLLDELQAAQSSRLAAEAGAESTQQATPSTRRRGAALGSGSSRG